MDLENNGGTDNDGESSAPVSKRRRHQVLDKDEQALASALSKSGQQQNPGTDRIKGGNDEGSNDNGYNGDNDDDIPPNGNDSDTEDPNDFLDPHDEDEIEDEGGSNAEDHGWNEVWFHLHLYSRLLSISFSRSLSIPSRRTKKSTLALQSNPDHLLSNLP